MITIDESSPLSQTCKVDDTRNTHPYVIGHVTGQNQSQTSDLNFFQMNVPQIMTSYGEDSSYYWCIGRCVIVGCSHYDLSSPLCQPVLRNSWVSQLDTIYRRYYVTDQIMWLAKSFTWRKTILLKVIQKDLKIGSGKFCVLIRKSVTILSYYQLIKKFHLAAIAKRS